MFPACVYPGILRCCAVREVSSGMWRYHQAVRLVSRMTGIPICRLFPLLLVAAAGRISVLCNQVATAEATCKREQLTRWQPCRCMCDAVLQQFSMLASAHRGEADD